MSPIDNGVVLSLEELDNHELNLYVGDKQFLTTGFNTKIFKTCKITLGKTINIDGMAHDFRLDGVFHAISIKAGDIPSGRFQIGRYVDESGTDEVTIEIVQKSEDQE